MLKKNSTPENTILDDDARRAHAQKQLFRSVATAVAIKVGVTVAVAIAAKAIVRKLEAGTEDSSEN